MEIFLSNSFICNAVPSVDKISNFSEIKKEVTSYALERGTTVDLLLQKELSLPNVESSQDLLKLPEEEIIKLDEGQSSIDINAQSTLDSIAVGILEYYKMNTQYTLTLDKVTFSVYEFYMNLKTLDDLQLALDTVANFSSSVLPSVKTSSKVTDVVITNNTVYIPQSMGFITEYKITLAILKILFNVIMDNERIMGTLEFASELLDVGEVHEVFTPSKSIGRQLLNYSLLAMNGLAPSISTCLKKLGYTLPNFLDTYNADTQQSMYMSKDNANVIIVQWSDFEFIGTVVLPIPLAQKIYRNKSALQFMTGARLFLNEPSLDDQKIATLNGTPLYTVLGLKLTEIMSPNILVKGEF